jgi:hypothetical protein
MIHPLLVDDLETIVLLADGDDTSSALLEFRLPTIRRLHHLPHRPQHVAEVPLQPGERREDTTPSFEDEQLYPMAIDQRGPVIYGQFKEFAQHVEADTRA